MGRTGWGMALGYSSSKNWRASAYLAVDVGQGWLLSDLFWMNRKLSYRLCHYISIWTLADYLALSRIGKKEPTPSFRFKQIENSA